jgi:hypothetical protein
MVEMNSINVPKSANTEGGNVDKHIYIMSDQPALKALLFRYVSCCLEKVGYKMYTVQLHWAKGNETADQL